MAQSPQQFTPQQILEAGRRAEAEGRIEYAIQFYRHLTDHLARSPEAATARDYLERLGATVGPSPGPAPATSTMNGHYQTSIPASAPHAAGPHSMGGQQNGMPLGPPGQTPVAPPGRGPVAGVHPGSGALIVRPAPANNAEPTNRRKFVLPKSRRRYRTGRFVARAFTVLGFFEIAVGVLLLGAGLLSKGPALPEFLAAQQQLIGVSLGLTVLIIGLVQVMGGQLARAIFDTASANRDLAAYARARAVFETGTADEQPSRD